MKIRLLISILLWYGTTYATHIVGGGMSLKYIGGKQYELTLKVLRDCVNGQAALDNPATIGMFDMLNNNKIITFTLYNPVISKLTITGADCASIPGTCTEIGIYKQVINFDSNTYNSTKGYYFAYLRCCRNGIIDNIVNPGDAAIAIYMEVAPFKLKNSTPEFASNPFTYLCLNNPFSYNLNFSDANSDSLVYTLTTPLNGPLTASGPGPVTNVEPGPYAKITWLPGFSDLNQITGSPPLTINRNTGAISITPNTPGIFVSSIRVEEYRKGVKIGEVRLELQFNVTTCASNPFPVVTFKNDNNTVGNGNYTVKVNDKLCFNILASDPADSLTSVISGPNWLNDLSNPYSPRINWLNHKAFKKDSLRFCWQTSCSVNDTGVQNFSIAVTDNGCPIPKTTTKAFKVTILSYPKTIAPQLGCLNHINTNTVQVNWTPKDSSTSFKAYRIYRNTAGGPFTLLATLPGYTHDLFKDVTSSNNLNQRYCYFVKSTDSCDRESDSSGMVCSFFTEDSSSTPGFIFTQDTLIRLRALDTFAYTATIFDADGNDSVFIQPSGSMLSSGRIFDILQKNEPGKGSFSFKYTVPCDAASDSFQLNLFAYDNQCPSPRKTLSSITITSDPLDPPLKPYPSCLDHISKDVIQFKWEPTLSVKTFQSYKIYKRIGNNDYSLLATSNNYFDSVFFDSAATDNLDNNYCYYLSTVDLCGKESDFSRIICTLYKEDTASIPGFYFNPDTTIYVPVNGLVTYQTEIYDSDGRDSVYINATGSLVNSGRLFNVTKTNGEGKASYAFNFRALCGDVDTLKLNLFVYDDQCPQPRSGIARVNIVVVPPYLGSPPSLLCVQYVNDSSIILKWTPPDTVKNFKSYHIYKSINGGDFRPLATVNKYYDSSYLDDKAFDNLNINYIYYIVTTNICSSESGSSNTVNTVTQDDSLVLSTFNHPKEILLRVQATDTLTYLDSIVDKNASNSVSINASGSLINTGRMFNIVQENRLGYAKYGFSFLAACEDIAKPDTLFIKLLIYDDQCPNPVATTSYIKVVVDLPKPSYPELKCIVKGDDSHVLIRWGSSTLVKSFSHYVLLRKDPAGNISMVTEVHHTDTFSYIDYASDNSARNYCYAVYAVTICGNNTDTSEFRCSIKTAGEFPLPTNIHTVSVENNKNIYLTWSSAPPTDFRYYNIYKRNKTAGQAFTFVHSTPDSVLVDEGVEVMNSIYCYSIRQINDCALEAIDSTEACSILLKGKSDPFEHSLNWNPYDSWAAGTDHYQVERAKTGSSPVAFAQTNPSVLNFLDKELDVDFGAYEYTITAFESNSITGGYKSISNTIELLQAPTVYPPNAFTPNGDGTNDSWLPVPVFVRDYYVKIYNRWGQVVFESNNKHEGFNGIVNNHPASNDVYVYLITYAGWNGQAGTLKGNITLFR